MGETWMFNSFCIYHSRQRDTLPERPEDLSLHDRDRSQDTGLQSLPFIPVGHKKGGWRSPNIPSPCLNPASSDAPTRTSVRRWLRRDTWTTSNCPLRVPVCPLQIHQQQCASLESDPDEIRSKPPDCDWSKLTRSFLSDEIDEWLWSHVVHGQISRPTSPANDSDSSVLRLIWCKTSISSQSCHGDEFQNRHSYPFWHSKFPYSTWSRHEIIYVPDRTHPAQEKDVTVSSLTSFDHWSSKRK